MYKKDKTRSESEVIKTRNIWNMEPLADAISN